MKFSRVLTLAICVLSFSYVTAQTVRRRPGRTPPPAPQAASQPTPAPTPAPTPFVPSVAPTSIQLAVVNGQTITVADLEPAVAEEVMKLEERIADARRQVLDLQVNTVLLDIEARKRKTTPQQLYDIEVTKRVTDPAEAEIKEFIDTNRDQIGSGDQKNIREDVIALLRGAREEKLSSDFVGRLRATNTVVSRTGLNTPNLSPSTVVATVGGRPITAEVLLERLKPIIYKLRLATHQMELAALDRTIDDVLLIAEATRRNVGPEDIVRAEITEKTHHPTEAEVTKFYTDNKSRITGELPDVRDQLANYLQQQDQEKLEHALSERLRKGAQIRVLLTEPALPIQTIAITGEPSRGDVNSRATVVEFTDFQCPACAGMQPVLEEVLKGYGDRVHFVVRNFPLVKHAQARKAAEAADAAQAQGKFFEYTALLFKRQNALDIPSLKKYASEIGLDRARFDAELDGDKYAAEVKRDIDDGQIYGVDATPSIFVNGVRLKDLTAEALRAAIDRALATPR